MAKQLLQTLCALVAVTFWSGAAKAQMQKGEFRPISKPGGYAQQELQQIYNQSIGTGYSSEGLSKNLANATRAHVPSVRRNTPTSIGPRIGLGVGSSGVNKPFTSYSPSPTVSPYLNLFREDIEGGGDFNYNTLVRPQLQQQQFNQQVQRQGLEVERRLQSFAAQSDFNPQGSTTQLPTGHQTVFRYYGRYHPRMNYRR